MDSAADRVRWEQLLAEQWWTRDLADIKRELATYTQPLEAPVGTVIEFERTGKTKERKGKAARQVGGYGV